MSPKIRTTFRIFGSLAGAMVLILTAGALWLAYASHQAKANVEAFCASVSLDVSSEGLAQRARASGLKVTEIPNPAGLSADVIMVMQGVGFARHICTIEHINRRVTKVERAFVD